MVMNTDAPNQADNIAIRASRPTTASGRITSFGRRTVAACAGFGLLERTGSGSAPNLIRRYHRLPIVRFPTNSRPEKRGL